MPVTSEEPAGPEDDETPDEDEIDWFAEGDDEDDEDGDEPEVTDEPDPPVAKKARTGSLGVAAAPSKSRPAERKPGPPSRHAGCSPDDPVARRLAPGPGFSILDSRGARVGEVMADFLDARKVLEAEHAGGTLVCAGCGVLLARMDGVARGRVTRRLPPSRRIDEEEGDADAAE